MDPVLEIKQRLQISDVVRDYATLHPGSGAGLFKAICPFHDDHDPSLVINDRKGFAWCFACNSGGDIFSFVQKIENCTFPEALKMLADKAGITLKEYRPPDQKEEDAKERLFSALALAADFFESELAKNAKAQDLLSERMIPESVLLKFKVGFAPDANALLLQNLLENGFSRKEMELCGLIVPNERERGEFRDKFKNRLMFPIWNSRGRICAFGGRYIGESEKAPKYLNSPETTLYKKSDILYGYHFAKEAIREQKFAILTEGYFDVLACFAAGQENAVAVAGTAFTSQHAKLLSRSASDLALALDIDAAGQTASRRAAVIALQNRLEVTVIPIPGGKDPDEAVREDKNAFLQAITERKPAVEIFITRAFLHRDPTVISDKKRIIDELLPVINAFPRDIERDHYLEIIATKLNTRRDILEKERRSYERLEETPSPKPTGIKRHISPLDYLFGIIFAFPEFFPESEKHLLMDLLAPDEKKFYNSLKESYNSSGILSPEVCMAALPSQEAEKWRSLSLFAEEALTTLPDTLRLKELHQSLQKVNLALIRRKQMDLHTALVREPSNKEILVQANELTKLLGKFHHQ